MDQIWWTDGDDYASCTGIVIEWQYRVAGSGNPMTVYRVHPDDAGGGAWGQWDWTEAIGTRLGVGSYDFEISVTDCAGQQVTSPTYYFNVTS